MGEWINIKDRLPEVGVPVLLLHHYEKFARYEPVAIGILNAEKIRAGVHKGELSDRRYFTFIGFWLEKEKYNYGIKINAAELSPGDMYVTHWMPLPKGE